MQVLVCGDVCALCAVHLRGNPRVEVALLRRVAGLRLDLTRSFVGEVCDLYTVPLDAVVHQKRARALAYEQQRGWSEKSASVSDKFTCDREVRL